MKFSVIIPTWNEGRTLAASLRRLREITHYDNLELIIADGGSTDNTRDVAARWTDRVINTRMPNRGAQMHAGAGTATGDLLFFLHADTQPPGNWQEVLEQFWLASHSSVPSATVFSVDYGSHWNYRLVAWGQNTRVDWRQIAYGDAGFCTSRENYDACGGIPEIPLLEDVVFSQRLKKLGPIVRLPSLIRPGARRLYKAGPLRNAMKNFWIRLRFSMGASPESLWRSYYQKKPTDMQGLSDGERALKSALKHRGER